MHVCEICKGQIKRGDKLVVVSFPVTCRYDGGDYSFLDDFSKNEKIVHLKCCPNIKSLFEQKSKPNTKSLQQEPDIVRLLNEALLDLGEKTTIQEVMVFCAKNKDISDIGELIKSWFQSRETLV